MTDGYEELREASNLARPPSRRPSATGLRFASVLANDCRPLPPSLMIEIKRFAQSAAEPRFPSLMCGE